MRSVSRVPSGYAAGGAAVASIWISVILASLFSPDMVSGAQQEHIPLAAATAWIWGAVATSAVATTVLEGSRAGTASPAPWTAVAAAVAALWAAALLVAIFSPVMVTGTDPTRLPLAVIGGPVLAMLGTRFLCNALKASWKAEPEGPAQPVRPAPDATASHGDGAGESSVALRLRELTHLRDAGLISSEEFEAKKAELLARI